MKTLFRILSYGKQWRWYFIGVLFTLVILTGLSLVLPIAIRELLNIIADISDYYSLPIEIWMIAGALLGVYVLRFFLEGICRLLSRYFAVKVLTKIRCDIYAHLQTLSPRFYHDKQVGQINSRVMEDVGKLPTLLVGSLPEFIVGIFTIIGVTVILFIMNPLLAAFVLAPLPFLLVISVFQRKMSRHWQKGKKLVGELHGTLSDNLQGMKEIQIFGKQDYEHKRFVEKNEDINKHAFFVIRWAAVLKPLMDFLQGIGTLIVVFVGAYFAMQGSVDAGEIVAFILYIGILYVPVAGIARVVEDGTDVITSISRTFEYLDAQSEVQERPNAVTVENLKGHVAFKNVSFGYKETPVLDDISFEASAGSMIALVGETGAGKTTIASLIARFYDIDQGTISIDEIDIRDMTLQSLRNHLSIVLQDVFLFNGTIAQNIAYGSSTEVTDEDILKASKSACIHEFIDALPDGYNTKIGERGVRLSGGQKQRLAIARALLRNSPILILDEATSSIDNTTEKEIQSAIDKLSQDKSKTIIVIAHRLSTIEKADKIIFLKHGKITEQGTHEELVSKNGDYAKLRNN